jgi:hypothetical protein
MKWWVGVDGIWQLAVELLDFLQKMRIGVANCEVFKAGWL